MTSPPGRNALTWGLLAVPVLAALAALAGALLDVPAWVTVAGAALVGVGTAWLLSSALRASVAGVAARLRRLSDAGDGVTTAGASLPGASGRHAAPSARSPGVGRPAPEAAGPAASTAPARDAPAPDAPSGTALAAPTGSATPAPDAPSPAATPPGAPSDRGPWDELEEALAAVAASLERRADEARRVDAVRRDFVTNASHELKTPVAAIQALSESIELAFDRDPERARGMVARLQTESARLASMIRDLLDLARLEELSADRSRTRVDVAEVVARQVERVGPAARERRIELAADLPEQAVVSGLPEDVRLIVGNLLDNAVRYNIDGGRVEVTVQGGDDAVTIEVADTGVGIPEAERDRVFERFYRIDKGRTRAAGGTGLGLALVRHAVQRAGGRIELESAPGQGSTFTVVLPVEPPA